MAKLEELAKRLREANPDNDAMTLKFMAKVFWPDADWLEKRAHRHNGGARRGALAAAGIAGKLRKAGLMRKVYRPDGMATISMWKLVEADGTAEHQGSTRAP